MNDPKTDFGFDYKNVSFESTRPGVEVPLVLRGWHVPAQASLKKRPLKVGIVAVHGGGRDRREWLPHVGYWVNSGMEVLLYDSSEHGISDGADLGLGFGYREHFDTVGAIRFAKGQLGWDKLVVVGTSVGGSSSLLATAKEPLADGVIAENPFYDYEPFFIKIYNDILGSGSFGGRDASKYGSLVNLVKMIAQPLPLESYIASVATFTRWWIGAAGQDGPIQVIKQIAPRPVYLIHGTDDEMIPPEHSSLLYKAAEEPKQIWIAENGKHADIRRFYPKEYEQKFIQFIEKHVLPPAPAEEQKQAA